MSDTNKDLEQEQVAGLRMPMAKCMKRSKLILMRIYSKPQRLEVPGTGESWGEAWDGK